MITTTLIGYLVLISFASFNRAQEIPNLAFEAPTVRSNEGVQLGGIIENSTIQADQDSGTEPDIVNELNPSNEFSENFKVPAYYEGYNLYKAINSPQPEPTSEQLVIASPLAGSKLTIGVPFNVLVTTLDTTIQSPITLIFESILRIPGTSVPGLTNVQQSVTLNSTFFEIEQLSVNATNPYTNPEPVRFVLKYELEFTVAPTFIVKGVPFDVFLQTSDTIVDPARRVLRVFLRCGTSLIKIWDDVPLNELARLSALPNDSNPDQLNCLLFTPEETIFYYEASTSVSVVSSPFRGQLQPITPEQQAEFAKSIAFPPSEI